MASGVGDGAMGSGLDCPEPIWIREREAEKWDEGEGVGASGSSGELGFRAREDKGVGVADWAGLVGRGPVGPVACWTGAPGGGGRVSAFSLFIFVLFYISALLFYFSFLLNLVL